MQRWGKLTGDLERATREMKALWEHPHKDPFFPVEVARYLILFSAIMGDVNASDRYYHEAVEKFAASEKVDNAFIRKWFGLCHGYRFHVTGNFHKADTLNTKALDLFQVYDNAWGQALVHECRAMIFGEQGRWDEALEACSAGMHVVGTLDLRRTPGQGALALGKAEALMEKGQLSHAQSTLDAHHADIQISQFHLFRCHLLQGGIEAAEGHMDSAVVHLDTALAISKTNGYHDWIPLQRPWILPLLVECHHRNQNRDYVEQLFMKTDRDTNAALNLLKNNKNTGHLRRTTEHLLSKMPHQVPAPLSISCLGNFSVSIGDRQILAKQWRSAKATLLFKYMVVHHEQGMIPKETLLEVAWPNEDAAVTRPRFHVALNTLRKLLEPDLVRGVPSAYIIRHNNGYRLEIGRDGRIDFIEFVKTANTAAAVNDADPELALDRYVKAASIYRGMFFKEDPYEEWMTGYRASLEQQFLQALSNIIGLYEKQGAWHQCIAYAETYLMHDKYAEPVYRDLMRFHSNAGNPSGAIETFQKCQIHIREELDCQLSEHTLNLYNKLNQV